MQPSIENIENIPLKRKPRAVSTFLKKTFQLLNQLQNSCCIKWAPNGIGFIVTNEELFSKTVLPKYFKHSNYSSFVRQLNMYNFHKIRETNSQSYFHHQCFDRDNKSAMAEIKRKPEKKKRKSQDSQDDRDQIQNQHQQTPIKHMRRLKDQCSKGHSNCETNHKILSEERVSLNLLLRQENQGSNQKLKQKNSKSEKNTTRHLFSQTFYQQNREKSRNLIQQQMQQEDQNSGSDKGIESSKNILSVSDDDRLSINDEIAQRIPRFNTKELFYPSTNNLFPFVGNIQPSTFSLFF